jgi:hypothetical protein
MDPETSLRYLCKPRISHAWALVHKPTYALVIYRYVILVRADSLIGQVGGGWALEIFNIWDKPLPLALTMYLHASKTLRTGPYKS